MKKKRETENEQPEMSAKRQWFAIFWKPKKVFPG